jgi:hypothetical protein
VSKGGSGDEGRGNQGGDASLGCRGWVADRAGGRGKVKGNGESLMEQGRSDNGKEGLRGRERRAEGKPSGRNGGKGKCGGGVRAEDGGGGVRVSDGGAAGIGDRASVTDSGGENEKMMAWAGGDEGKGVRLLGEEQQRSEAWRGKSESSGVDGRSGQVHRGRKRAGESRGPGHWGKAGGEGLQGSEGRAADPGDRESMADPVKSKSRGRAWESDDRLQAERE